MNPTHDSAPPAFASLQDSFATLHAASRGQGAPDWPTRAAHLQRLRAMLMQHRAAIVQAIATDFGQRPRQETELAELFPVVTGINHALKHGRRWIAPRRRRTGLWMLPGASRLLPQPLGVVGIVTPWNYPLELSIGPLTAALAAGNRALIKLSEFSPAFSTLMAGLIEQTFAADTVRVIEGDAEVARAFSALPFDHLLFTGSTAVGHAVMRAASEHLTPVTLELGGKSPVIIGPGADLAHAAERIMVGKLLNAGQTCIAPDHVLLPAGREDDFVRLARAAVARLYPNLAQSPDYTRIINARQYQRLAGYLQEAQQAGTRIEPLADAPDDAALRRLTPRLLLAPAESLRVMQDEIFGPLLPVIGTASVDEAIAHVNRRPRPLALYVFEKDGAVIDQVLARTTSGGVTVNDTLLHFAQDDLPFGGVGASGMGAYHGQWGFDALSHLKPVFTQSMLAGVSLLKPPYGATFDRMMRWMMR
ncbi:coniferyl aldehyde dehydrogenase [Ottowia testudinis]|uniref:Aldehyde dehydrogenase n=1 Tax=Ottowia testudinis TaxID=2816950 RepID=A0A975H6S6_9BURK|nr:coniferyl aldehyde dehydrogenase [Ottowia testudinis]QTD46307.1 coniferyl aldehyde dehydrogenase [Ottowia testudinis]